MAVLNEKPGKDSALLLCFYLYKSTEDAVTEISKLQTVIMQVQLGNFYVFFKMISIQFYPIYILYFWHLNRSLVGMLSSLRFASKVH